MRTGLSIALWLAFLTIVVAGAIVLLRACGLLMPLASLLPELRWNFCPVTPAALTGEAERRATLESLARRLELEIAQRSLACADVPKPTPPPLELPTRDGSPRPQQTALLKPPPPPPPPLPAERWAKKDIGVLKGCWNLGRDAPSVLKVSDRTEQCISKAGRICFDGEGRGEREQIDVCPESGRSFCKAPITAQFGNDGTFKTVQEEVGCDGGPGSRWLGRSLTCRRIDDNRAMCWDSGNAARGIPGVDLEFRRAP